MNQILFGASVVFLPAALIYAIRGFRASLRMLVWAPVLMAAGALWAIVPDIPRVIGWYDLYHRLALDPRMNIFLWHYSIDQVEVDALWYLPAGVLMLGGLLAAAWRELYLLEKR
jgi:hypothetical protein